MNNSAKSNKYQMFILSGCKYIRISKGNIRPYFFNKLKLKYSKEDGPFKPISKKELDPITGL